MIEDMIAMALVSLGASLFAKHRAKKRAASGLKPEWQEEVDRIVERVMRGGREEDGEKKEKD